MNISFLNHWGKRVKKSQKLGIIQAVLQTFNAKFKNTKIGTIIYISWSVVLSTMYISSIDGGAQA